MEVQISERLRPATASCLADEVMAAVDALQEGLPVEVARLRISADWWKQTGAEDLTPPTGDPEQPLKMTYGEQQAAATGEPVHVSGDVQEVTLLECPLCAAEWNPATHDHNCLRLSRDATVPIAASEIDGCRNCGRAPATLTARRHPCTQFCSVRCLDEIDERLGVLPPPEAVPWVLGEPIAVAAPAVEKLQRVWTSILEGNLCGTLLILRRDLPRERQAMRRLLHERLQSFGDALLEEYDKQIWEEEG
jgi:hypothetical protein